MAKDSLFRQQHALISQFPGAYVAYAKEDFWRLMRACYHGDFHANQHGVLIELGDCYTFVWLDGEWVDWDCMPVAALGYDANNVLPSTRREV